MGQFCGLFLLKQTKGLKNKKLISYDIGVSLADFSAIFAQKLYLEKDVNNQ